MRIIFRMIVNIAPNIAGIVPIFVLSETLYQTDSV